MSIWQNGTLAIVAEANLRCGGFLSAKRCRHSAGNFSFFLVLTTRHSLSFHKFKRQSCLFGLIMHCSLVNGTWECLVFDFSFFCGIVSFYVPISDAVFLVTSFFIFDQCLADVIILLCSFLFICSVLLG